MHTMWVRLEGITLRRRLSLDTASSLVPPVWGKWQSGFSCRFSQPTGGKHILLDTVDKGVQGILLDAGSRELLEGLESEGGSDHPEGIVPSAMMTRLTM